MKILGIFGFFLSISFIILSCFSCDCGNEDESDDDDGAGTVDDDDATDDEIIEITIPADSSEWTRISIEVEAGDMVEFTATGSVILEPGGDPIGPDGVDGWCDECTSEILPKGALIGKMAESLKNKDKEGWWDDAWDEVFIFGEDYYYCRNQKGEIDWDLIINDNNHLDNLSNMEVHIRKITNKKWGTDEDYVRGVLERCTYLAMSREAGCTLWAYECQPKTEREACEVYLSIERCRALAKVYEYMCQLSVLECIPGFDFWQIACLSGCYVDYYQCILGCPVTDTVEECDPCPDQCGDNLFWCLDSCNDPVKMIFG